MDQSRKIIFAEDIMTRDVISVFPETSLIEAARIISEHGFDGVPVIDQDKKLVGILTEYDLISKGSAMHLPTFQKLIQELPVLGKDKPQFSEEVRMLSELTVKDVMNMDPLTLPPDTTFEEVVKTFRDHHRVNPIPVVDDNNKVVGVISRFDVFKPMLMLPQPPVS